MNSDYGKFITDHFVPLSVEEKEIVRKKFTEARDVLLKNTPLITSMSQIQENTKWKDLLADQTAFKFTTNPIRFRNRDKSLVEFSGVWIFVYKHIGHIHEKNQLTSFSLNIEPMGKIRMYHCKRWQQLNCRNSYDYGPDISKLNFEQISKLFSEDLLY